MNQAHRLDWYKLNVWTSTFESVFKYYFRSAEAVIFWVVGYNNSSNLNQANGTRISDLTGYFKVSVAALKHCSRTTQKQHYFHLLLQHNIRASFHLIHARQFTHNEPLGLCQISFVFRAWPIALICFLLWNPLGHDFMSKVLKDFTAG